MGTHQYVRRIARRDITETEWIREGVEYLAFREIIGSQIMSFLIGHFKDVDFYSEDEKGNITQFPAELSC